MSFGLPKGIIYGGHGGLLGHEMVHGFDSSGKDYDKDGYQFKWWSKAEDKEYAKRTQYMVRSSFTNLIERKEINMFWVFGTFSSELLFAK